MRPGASCSDCIQRPRAFSESRCRCASCLWRHGLHVWDVAGSFFLRVGLRSGASGCAWFGASFGGRSLSCCSVVVLRRRIVGFCARGLTSRSVQHVRPQQSQCTVAIAVCRWLVRVRARRVAIILSIRMRVVWSRLCGRGRCFTCLGVRFVFRSGRGVDEGAPVVVPVAFIACLFV